MCVSETERCGVLDVSCCPDQEWGTIPGEDVDWARGFSGMPYDVMGLIVNGRNYAKVYKSTYVERIQTLLDIDLDGECRCCERAYGELFPYPALGEPVSCFTTTVNKRAAMLFSDTHLFMGRQVVCWYQIAPLIFRSDTRVINMNTFTGFELEAAYIPGKFLFSEIVSFSDERLHMGSEFKFRLSEGCDDAVSLPGLCSVKYSAITVGMIKQYMQQVRDQQIQQQKENPEEKVEIISVDKPVDIHWVTDVFRVSSGDNVMAQDIRLGEDLTCLIEAVDSQVKYLKVIDEGFFLNEVDWGITERDVVGICGVCRVLHEGVCRIAILGQAVALRRDGCYAGYGDPPKDSDEKPCLSVAMGGMRMPSLEDLTATMRGKGAKVMDELGLALIEAVISYYTVRARVVLDDDDIMRFQTAILDEITVASHARGDPLEMINFEWGPDEVGLYLNHCISIMYMLNGWSAVVKFLWRRSGLFRSVVLQEFNLALDYGESLSRLGINMAKLSCISLGSLDNCIDIYDVLHDNTYSDFERYNDAVRFSIDYGGAFGYALYRFGVMPKNIFASSNAIRRFTAGLYVLESYT